MLLRSMWPKEWLTKVITSKIVTFCYFWPKMGKNFSFVLLANLAFSFHSDISTCFVLVNIYLMQNIKKTHWDNCFSLFFHNILATIWPKFCPKDHTQFTFFWLISNEICWAGDSININNLCFNQVYKKKTIFKRFYIPFFRTSYTYSSEKKLKPLKNCFLNPICKR